MNMTYTDADGNTQIPIMGCYGIGVGRLAASIAEASHDKFGPIWPISIAPWSVEVCCLRADDPQTKKISEDLYQALENAGVDTLYDDRDIRPGAMFSDADLLGAPVRVIVSPKNLANGEIEISTRDKSIQVKVPVADALDKTREIIKTLQDRIDETVPESI